MLNAIGSALIPSFLAVEAQLAQHVAGILQCIAVVLLVLWPVLHVRTRQGDSTSLPDPDLRVARGLRMPWPAPRRFL